MYQKPAWSTWLTKTIRLPNLFGEYARNSRLLWFPCSIRSAFSLYQTGGRPTDDGVIVETTTCLYKKDRTRNSLFLSSHRRSHFLKSLTIENAWEKRLKRGVKALPTKRKFNPTEKRSKRDYLKVDGFVDAYSHIYWSSSVRTSEERAPIAIHTFRNRSYQRFIKS